MKIEINENSNQKELKFPCLMKSKKSGQVLLIIAVNKNYDNGICQNQFYEGVTLSDGTYSKLWAADFLEQFNGSVTLSNE